MLRSPASMSLSKRLLTAASLAMLATIPVTAHASTLTTQTSSSRASVAQGNDHHQWLIADKDDKYDKKDRDDDRGRRWDDNNQGVRRIDLNRAKNLARQAAEEANGGIRVYRAEDSMHGPANQCPYVDNGDSWTFTFLGRRVNSTAMTIRSVVTVYKTSSRVIVASNGPVRNVQETQFVNFTTSQRTVLAQLLQGNCSCNSLLSNTLRTQIISQSRSLPRGIQKQLLRGKGLPPGIAKKVLFLPQQVNTYVNLPAYYRLGVIGSNLVLLDQVNYTVVDYISEII
jgi:hypothetical protein